MLIRAARTEDLPEILEVHREAFGGEAEAVLVARLVADPSARPVLSLVAGIDGRIAGHILFTHAAVDDQGREEPACLLAPMAVRPNLQRRGIGGRLIAGGVERLTRSGVALVLVLGHPEYYPRHGFEPAMPLGIDPPYPLPEEASDAWMVRFTGTRLRHVRGRTRCADSLSDPALWRE